MKQWLKDKWAGAWGFLWKTEMPLLVQLIGFAVTLFIGTQIDDWKSATERRADSFVSQIHSFETDATQFNVVFGQFADTLIRPEMSPESERQAARLAMIHDRETARAALLSSLVRQQSDADMLKEATDPSLRPLIDKYEQKISITLDAVREANNFDDLRPAYNAAGDLLDVQRDLLLTLRQKAGLTV